MTEAAPSPRSGVSASHQALHRLIQDLDRWGTLFSDVAKAKGSAPAEQILGGLVDWMGNGLIDGWLHLPIPIFEQVSQLAEELFQACQSYLGRLRDGARPLSPPERARHETAILAVLGRAHALLPPENGPTPLRS